MPNLRKRPMKRSGLYTAKRLKGIGSKRFRKKGTSGRGVTFEHDRQFIYKRRRMPYRRKRRWVKFNRRVHAVAEKGLGSRTVVISSNAVYSPPGLTASDQPLQGVACYGLYTNKSTIGWFNDLNLIAGRENTGDPTAAAGQTVGGTTKLFFQSGILDMTLRNVSDDGTDLLPDATLEVDLYEMSIRSGEYDAGGTTYTQTKEYFRRGAIITNNLGGTAGTSALDIEDRGVTPWDLPAALSRNKIKIWKKTKFFLRSGQTLTYQVRDPKRRVTTIEKLTSTADTCNFRGWTKHIMVIFKFVPGFVTTTTSVPKIQAGVTRKYLYKVEGIRDDRDYYLRN